jgi:hypothetical protein
VPAETRIEPIDPRLAETPQSPGQWPVEAETIEQAKIERYWMSDRSRGRECVARFTAYRTAVERRDARLRGGE